MEESIDTYIRTTEKTGAKALESLEPMLMETVKTIGIKQKTEKRPLITQPKDSQKMKSLKEELNKLRQQGPKAKPGEKCTEEEFQKIKQIRQKKVEIKETQQEEKELQWQLVKEKRQRQTTVPRWEGLFWAQTRKPKAMGFGLRMLRNEQEEVKIGVDI